MNEKQQKAIGDHIGLRSVAKLNNGDLLVIYDERYHEVYVVTTSGFLMELRVYLSSRDRRIA
jgi:hypothetical protein